MDNKITSLQPQAVWKYFNAICQVPRPSGHLDKITEYIMGVGRSLGLETILDKAGNVIIRKPATPGMGKPQAGYSSRTHGYGSSGE